MSANATRFRVGVELEPNTTSRCAACDKPFVSGLVYAVPHDATPWKAEDDESREYGYVMWHEACDEGSLVADLASRRVSPSSIYGHSLKMMTSTPSGSSW